MGLLGRKSSTRQPTTVVDENEAVRPKSGLFGKRRMSSDDSHTGASKFAFSKKDSLTTARQKLNTAVQAEKDADAALIASRNAVKAARKEISLLESEAKEEERLAKMKVLTASKMRKAGDKLGKH